MCSFCLRPENWKHIARIFYGHIISHASFKPAATTPTNHSIREKKLPQTEKLKKKRRKSRCERGFFSLYITTICHCSNEMNTFTPQHWLKQKRDGSLSTHRSLAKIETKRWCFVSDREFDWFIVDLIFVFRSSILRINWRSFRKREREK